MPDDADPEGQRRSANDSSRPPERVTAEERASRHGPDDAAPDLEMTVEQLPMANRRAALSLPSGASARALSLGLAGLLVVAVIAVLVNTISGAAAPAFIPPGLRPIAGLPTIPPGTGWAAAGPANAQAIAFVRVPGAPTVAYTCGAAAAGEQAPRIAVNVSPDGGRTWQQRAGVVPGRACQVTVDPTDPRDVVLATTPYPLFGLHPPVSLFRSVDGGDIWSPFAVPLPADIAQYVTAYSWAWAGSSFFFAPFLVQGTGNWTRLAVSVARQAFVWVDQNGLFDGAPSNASIDTLVGMPTGIYVVLTRGNQCTQQCFPLMRTGNLGASWTPFTATYQGAPIQLLQGATSGDDVSLFGATAFDSAASATYLRSIDGGATWMPLPAFPGHYAALRLIQAPNGTLFAAIQNCCGSPENVRPGLYRLLPGATTWTVVGSEPGDGGNLLAVASDANGSPLALWGGAHLPSTDQVRPGLETHAP